MGVYHRLVRIGFLLHNFLRRPQLYRVRCAIFYQGEILLVRHVGGANEWSLPGGGIHRNETPIIAAEREVWEELKLTVSNLRELEHMRVTHKYVTTDNVLVRGEATMRKLRRRKWELQAAEWFTLDDLPTPLSPTAKRVIDITKS
ncbi:MAG: NUDIX domain-containing protein [Candidatus Saccharimonadales bacterium]